MTRAQPKPFRRFSSLLAFAMLAMLAIGLGAAHAEGVEAAPSVVTAPSAGLSDADRAQAQALAKTLEDPDARAKLVAQLKLLAEVAKPPATAPAKAGPLAQLLLALQGAGDTILTTASDLADVGNVVDWLAAQKDDPKAQERVGRVLLRLVAVFLGGLIVEFLLKRALAHPRRYFEPRPSSGRWWRALLAAARLVCDLVPVAGFAASAYAMLALPLYRPGGHSELVSVAAITAYALSAAVAKVIDAIFAPDRTHARALALDDADAVRLTHLSRRILRTGIWGYYFDDALRILGLPDSGFASLLKLLGLVVTIQLVSLVFEFRRPVSRWIRGFSVSPRSDTALARVEFDRRIAGLRNGLADIWHVLAALYVLAAFVIWALRVEDGFEFLLRATFFTAAILVAARVLSSVIGRYTDRAFHLGEGIDPHGKIALRRRRYRRITRAVLELAIVILAVLAVLEAWGADTLSWLGGDTGQHLTSAAATIVVTFAISVAVWELVNASIEQYLTRTDPEGKLVARSARARTLLPLIRNAFTVFIVLVVAMIVLTQVGVNVAPLIAGAGVLGVAIGFGSQKLVQDVITGAFMLFEDTIAVGDTVAIGDHVGIVEGMTIRTMRIRSANGDLHTVPFSSVSVVVNQSRGFAYFSFTVAVSYGENVDRVMEVMRAVGAELRKDAAWSGLIGAPVEVFGIDKFTDMAVIVSGQIRTQSGQQVPVGREYYRRLKLRFDELGIVIPHTPSVDTKPPAPATPAPTPAPEPTPDAREP